MSATNPTTPPPAPTPVEPPKAAMEWGAPAVSMFALAIFAGSIIVAMVLKSASLDILLGAAAANATAVISYWVGSSSGSQKKDQSLAAVVAASQTPKAS